MKFAEMPYQRVDTDAVVAGLIKSFMSCVTSTAR